MRYGSVIRGNADARQRRRWPPSPFCHSGRRRRIRVTRGRKPPGPRNDLSIWRSLVVRSDL